MQKLVTAVLTAVIGVFAHPSVPERTPSQIVTARWADIKQERFFDQIEMLIALQGARSDTN